MKRFIATMLAIMMLITMMPTSVFAEDAVESMDTLEVSVEPTSIPTTEPMPEMLEEDTEEPISEITTKPAIESTPEATTEPTTEPTSVATTESTIEPISEDGGEPTTESTPDSSTEPIVELMANNSTHSVVELSGFDATPETIELGTKWQFSGSVTRYSSDVERVTLNFIFPDMFGYITSLYFGSNDTIDLQGFNELYGIYSETGKVGWNFSKPGTYIISLACWTDSEEIKLARKYITVVDNTSETIDLAAPTVEILTDNLTTALSGGGICLSKISWTKGTVGLEIKSIHSAASGLSQEIDYPDFICGSDTSAEVETTGISWPGTQTIKARAFAYDQEGQKVYSAWASASTTITGECQHEGQVCTKDVAGEYWDLYGIENVDPYYTLSEDSSQHQLHTKCIELCKICCSLLNDNVDVTNEFENHVYENGLCVCGHQEPEVSLVPVWEKSRIDIESAESAVYMYYNVDSSVKYVRLDYEGYTADGKMYESATIGTYKVAKKLFSPVDAEYPYTVIKNGDVDGSLKGFTEGTISKLYLTACDSAGNSLSDRSTPFDVYCAIPEEVTEAITLKAEPSGEIVEGTTVSFTVESNSSSVTLYIDAFEAGTGNRYTAVEKDMTKNGTTFNAENKFTSAGKKIVWAMTADGTKSAEIEINVVPAEIKLDTPVYTGATTAIVGESITFSWTAVDNATGYTAWIRPVNNMDDVTNLSDSISGQYVSHTFTEAGSYYLEIYAVGEEGYGASDACKVTITVDNPTICDHSGLNYEYVLDTTEYVDTGDGVNHKIVNSYSCYCKDCGAFINDGVKDEYPPLEAHVFDANGVCIRNCGAKIEVDCKHEGAYTDYNVWSDEGQKIAENWYGNEEYVVYSENAEDPARYHNAATLYFRVCNDCGRAFDAVYGKAMSEKHDYTNGDVCVCGYDRDSCVHKATADSTKYIGIICQQNDAATHYVVADKYMYTCEYCEKIDCIAVIPRSEDQWELQGHTWDKDGVCQSEGCEYACEHTEYTTAWVDGKSKTVSITDNKDGATHTHVYTAKATCSNCQKNLGMMEETYSAEEHRVRNGKTYYKEVAEGHQKVTPRVCSCGYSEKPITKTEVHRQETTRVDIEYFNDGNTHTTLSSTYAVCICGKEMDIINIQSSISGHIDKNNDGICDLCKGVYSIDAAADLNYSIDPAKSGLISDKRISDGDYFDLTLASTLASIACETYSLTNKSGAKQEPITLINEGFKVLPFHERVENYELFGGINKANKYGADGHIGYRQSEDMITIIISFEGTFEMVDWTGDFMASRNEQGIHTGFYETTMCFVNKMNSYKLDGIILNGDSTWTLEELIDYTIETGSDEVKFLVTGHSLGGAQAQVFTYLLLKQGMEMDSILTYTYASPIPFSIKSDAMKYTSAHVYNIIDKGDSVPKLGVTENEDMLFVTQTIAGISEHFGERSDKMSGNVQMDIGGIAATVIEWAVENPTDAAKFFASDLKGMLAYSLTAESNSIGGYSKTAANIGTNVYYDTWYTEAFQQWYRTSSAIEMPDTIGSFYDLAAVVAFFAGFSNHYSENYQSNTSLMLEGDKRYEIVETSDIWEEILD